MAEESLNNRENKHPFSTYIASPSVRKAAREKGIQLRDIEGSGQNGRILHADLESENLKTTRSEKVIPFKQQGIGTEQRAYQEIPFRGIRKKIAENMVNAVQTIPHVTHYDRIDITELQVFRQSLKETGEQLSIVVFYLKALAVALQEFPIFNAQLDEEHDEIERSSVVNIGLATDTPDGLVVPVLNNIESKSFKTIQTEMKALTQKAQDGHLKMNEMKGGTFTISNVGPLGGVWATPIINHPQTGIMAFHKMRRVPVDYQNDEYHIKSMMNISLSFDHRVADGADAVRFTNRFMELLEQPEKLIIHM